MHSVTTDASRGSSCPLGNGHRQMARSVSRVRAPRGVPRYAPDVFAPSAVRNPYPHYAALRELGPVVWLDKQRVYALPRHAEVKAVLADDETFVSGRGVGLNPVVNRFGEGTTLNSDGDTHRTRRQLVGHRLTPRALRTMQVQVDDLAEATVTAALARRCVDGVADIALKLPLTVVPDLVGWPVSGRANLVRWAGATFDLLGPANERAVRAVPNMLAVQRFVTRLVKSGNVLPGSMADEVLRAAEAGKVDLRECPKLLIDYMAPSIDTTASAIAAGLWLFATNPDQWQQLKATPDLVAGAVQEIVRIESPLRAFSRVAARDVEIAGAAIPAGARLLIMYASANRDERVFADPDRFDITRDSSAHVGFGHGTHGCAGQGLARMETQAILRSLLRHVERIELAGSPEIAVNNIIHRFERLPLRLVPTKESKS